MIPKIKEIIIVEGRSDTAAVKRAVDAQTIETHGFGISGETWSLIQKAYDDMGIVILTDPDFAGEQIRRNLLKRFPHAKHAHVSSADAAKSGAAGVSGVEFATPAAIAEAIEKAKARVETASETFTYEDMMELGLTGGEHASDRRMAAGRHLGIGYGNTRSFLSKLNKFGVTRGELNEAVLAIGDS